jgi:Spy/CpxP family protein refolding chaperone
MESPRRARLLSIALLLAVFVAGAFTGVAADHLWLLHRLAPRVHGPAGPHGPPGSPGHRARDVHGELARRLDLTPAQRAKLDTIFARRGPRVDSIMRSMRPVLESELDATHAEVEAVLTPEQRVEFRKITGERHGPVPHGGGHPPPGAPRHF